MPQKCMEICVSCQFSLKHNVTNLVVLKSSDNDGLFLLDGNCKQLQIIYINTFILEINYADVNI